MRAAWGWRTSCFPPKFWILVSGNFLRQEQHLAFCLVSSRKQLVEGEEDHTCSSGPLGAAFGGLEVILETRRSSARHTAQSGFPKSQRRTQELPDGGRVGFPHLFLRWKVRVSGVFFGNSLQPENSGKAQIRPILP